MESKEISPEYYSTILAYDEIIVVAQAARDFEDGTIKYGELMQKLEVKGISITPRLIDPKQYRTVKQVTDFKNRVANLTLVSSDMQGYLISSDHYKNVYFRYDRFSIELLANNGDEKAKIRLKSLRDWEANFPKGQKLQQQNFGGFEERFTKPRK